jgi:hypothetical protein
LLKEEAAKQRVEREQVRKLKEEQKAQARIEQQAELLVKKQAKALKAIRKDLNKAAKPAKLLRKALIQSKIAVVVPQVEMKVSRATSRGRAYRLPARYNN